MGTLFVLLGISLWDYEEYAWHHKPLGWFAMALSAILLACSWYGFGRCLLALRTGKRLW